MTSLSALAPRAAMPPRVGATQGALPVFVAPLLLLIALIALRPIGYLGGGGDDFHYLEAARCAARHGFCLPDTHWQARFPLVAPMGWTMAALGESLLTVGLVPFAYAAAATILFALNVHRRFGRAAAILAGCALVLTPAFSLYALKPLADLPELAWTLAALLAAQVAVERGDRRAALLAGIALAVAVMTRMSALAFVPLAGLAWLALPRDRRALALPFAAGFAGVLAVEAMAYWLATGDAARGWLLSLHHSRIPTNELPAGIDLSRGALFNLDLIRGWKRSMGIEVHWAIDPLLNLLADPHCGLTLIGAAGLAAARWRDARTTRWIGALAVATVLHFVILTYVLAVDPKPRMFLFEFAVAATAIGVIGIAAWRRGGRLIVAALMLLMAVRVLAMTADRIDPRPAEAAAVGWIAKAPRGLAIDEWSHRTMALTPAAFALPVADAGYRGAVLSLTTDGCVAAAAARGPGWRIARAQAFGRTEPAFVTTLRDHAILLGPRVTPSLCILAPR